MHNAMELILWGRDRSELPEIPRDEWRQAAARCYQNPVLENARFGNENWIRLVCGALAVRAMKRDWQDLAEQYHRRYWDRTDVIDSDQELQRATDYVIDIEDSHRAHIADFPRQ